MSCSRWHGHPARIKNNTAMAVLRIIDNVTAVIVELQNFAGILARLHHDGAGLHLLITGALGLVLEVNAVGQPRQGRIRSRGQQPNRRAHRNAGDHIEMQVIMICERRCDRRPRRRAYIGVRYLIE